MLYKYFFGFMFKGESFIVLLGIGSVVVIFVLENFLNRVNRVLLVFLFKLGFLYMIYWEGSRIKF